MFIIIHIQNFQNIAQGVVANYWNKLCFRQLPVTSIFLKYDKKKKKKNHFVNIYFTVKPLSLHLFVIHCTDSCKRKKYQSRTNK